jgi:DNA-binding CsgD family transcriptional regulator
LTVAHGVVIALTLGISERTVEAHHGGMLNDRRRLFMP